MKNFIKTGGNQDKNEANIEAKNLLTQRKKDVKDLQRQIKYYEKTIHDDKSVYNKHINKFNPQNKLDTLSE